jgi:hypothetical protein
MSPTFILVCSDEALHRSKHPGQKNYFRPPHRLKKLLFSGFFFNRASRDGNEIVLSAVSRKIGLQGTD